MYSCPGAFMSIFTPGRLKKDILPVVQSLCQDVDYEVRGCMCRQLDPVARGLGWVVVDNDGRMLELIVAINQGAEFCLVNMKIYLHFLSCLKTEMKQVVEIIPCRRQWPVYPAEWARWLLITWGTNNQVSAPEEAKSLNNFILHSHDIVNSCFTVV